jgi:peptidoglycan/LPS O-acetylase OafA/YrhL
VRIKKVESLQILRAFAALLVVLTHVWGGASTVARGPSIGGALNFEQLGGFGVDIFFCISGFIMVTSVRSEASSIRAAFIFMGARIRRIYPIYCFWTFAMLPLVFLAAQSGTNWGISAAHGLSPTSLIHALLLLPALPSDHTFRLLLPQAWTLVYEMYFYALFAVCLAVSGKRMLVPCLAFLMLGIFGLSHFGIGIGERQNWVNLTYMIGDPITLDFLAGAIYGRIYESLPGLRLRGTMRLVSPLLALTVFVVGCYVIDGPRIVRAGIPAFVILILTTMSDVRPTLVNRILVYLGDASYSIYLVHIFVAIPAIKVAEKISLPPDVTGFIMSVAAVAFGCASYAAIEMPLNRLFTRIGKGSGTINTVNTASMPDTVGLDEVARLQAIAGAYSSDKLPHR